MLSILTQSFLGFRWRDSIMMVTREPFVPLASSLHTLRECYVSLPYVFPLTSLPSSRVLGLTFSLSAALADELVPGQDGGHEACYTHYSWRMVIGASSSLFHPHARLSVLFFTSV